MFEPSFILLRAGRTLVGGWVSVKMKWAEVGDGEVGFQRPGAGNEFLRDANVGFVEGKNRWAHGRRGIITLPCANSRRLKK